ncbi:MAG: hypothetical protein IRZ19_06775 [Pyrinomonas methylaliphatogenes]|jgi:signal transduction histidine kinase|nr:hypothetical protein [Pyrinomonas methylaliphatogenes]
MISDQNGGGRVDWGSEREIGELRALIKQQGDRMEAIVAIVARVRHEVNNPLAGVIGQAQLLLRDELSPKQRQRVETIERLAKRIKEILGELNMVRLD